MFMIISKYAFFDVSTADGARVAAQIVSGIGFLGAGTIMKDHSRIKGLTTAASLWIYYFMTPQPEMIFSTSVTIKMFSAALTLGFAYAAWNIGILHGNVTIMAVGSYFTPVLSSALAAVLLSAPLSLSFWQGALMVCAGSLLCWLATRRA